MVISVKHKFASPKADGADATLVQPSNWNDEHALTLAASRLLGRYSTTAGAAEEISLGSALTFNGSVLNVDTAGPAAKATPVDADSLLINDSAAANIPKRLTWAALKSNLKTYFDTLYAAAGSYVVATRQVIAGNGLSGGGALSADRTLTLGTPGSITNSTANTVTSTSHTHALGFTAAEVYTGSSSTVTDVPVGYPLLISNDTTTNRNATSAVYHGSGSSTYSYTGTTAMAGTWRGRGQWTQGGQIVGLYQRTA